MKNVERGFTLLELLIVITIIGILSAIVLSALSQSKNKGGDAGVKVNLLNARSQSSYYFNGAATSTNSYDGMCNDRVNGVMRQLIAAASAGGSTYVAGDAQNITATQTACHDTATAWAAGSPIKDATGAWCVDSTNFSGRVALTALDTDNDVTCQ